MKTPYIQLSELSVVFETHKGSLECLSHLNLSVEKGDFVCIRGTSGSGKSTLLNVLGLLLKPSAGRYHLSAQDTAEFSRNTIQKTRLNRIGFVFQEYNLLYGLTALENVVLPLKYRGIGKNERRRTGELVLERIGLADKRDETPAVLSGGEQQRLAVGRSLAAQPELLLVDEPTGNLDPASRDGIMQLITDLNRENNTTVILVTHDPAVAEHAATNYELKNGNLRKT